MRHSSIAARTCCGHAEARIGKIELRRLVEAGEPPGRHSLCSTAGRAESTKSSVKRKELETPAQC